MDNLVKYRLDNAQEKLESAELQLDCAKEFLGAVKVYLETREEKEQY